MPVGVIEKESHPVKKKEVNRKCRVYNSKNAFKSTRNEKNGVLKKKKKRKKLNE